MRLGAAGGPAPTPEYRGFFRAETVAELDAVAERLDRYGLSALPSPFRTPEMTEEECVAFGERAAKLDIVVSEVHFLANLYTTDPEIRRQRIEEARAMLRKADLMRARCLVGFAGSAHSSGSMRIPCADNFTTSFKAEVREMILRVLDGQDLQWTKYGLESSPRNFFYEPEECAAFIDAVGHPDFGLHLDIMNMISQATLYRTTEVIEQTFDLMKDRIYSAHVKDLSWDWSYQFLKFDEVIVGDGELDYQTVVRCLMTMDDDFPAMCEHLITEQDYIVSFERLHAIAAELGATWLARRAGPPA
jgi:sugar phosphate isomerase/epimerase